MNKTTVSVCFLALAAVGLIGAVALAIHRPDATATFTSLIVTVLGIAASAAERSTRSANKVKKLTP